MPVISAYYKKESRITMESCDNLKVLKFSFNDFTYSKVT